MFQMRPISLAVHAALGMAAGATAMPVLAASEGVVEEIVVTGSRIERANMVTSSPVAQLDAEQLQLTGTTRIEDVLRSMPQISLDQDSGQSIEAVGTATLQLRNLGASRTLVLVDGRRLPYSSPNETESGADLNFIPQNLVKRVEVLTGGASAAYGSDAVAGVVNFIMVDDFEGVALDFQVAGYRHENNGRIVNQMASRGFEQADGTANDGDIEDWTFMIGGNLNEGRGNVTAYATYRNVDPVTQAERDYSGCALNSSLTACGGSGTSAAGTFYFAQDGYSAPFNVSGTDWAAGIVPYNFAPPSYYQRPDERYTLGAFAHYEISEQVEAYTQLMFMDNRTTAQFAPAGFFFDYGVDISCANPLLSAQQQGVIGCTGPTDVMNAYIGRRNVEGGARFGDLRHTTYRGVFGLRGDLNEAWSYDMSYQYAEVDMRNRNGNYMDTARIGLALDVVLDAGGNPVCRAVVDGTDPNCVPWNIYQSGGVDAFPGATDYLSKSYFERGTTDQTVALAYVQGDLGEYGVKSPWADNGIDVLVGIENREENLNYQPDDGAIAGDIGGLAAALVPVSGGFEVTDYFIEAVVPIVEGRNWAELVSLDLGYRYSDYDTGVTTDTYKIAGQWALNQQVMLRASFQRAVRAANINELFQPVQGTLFDLDNDPCSGVTLVGGASGSGTSVAGYTFTECARSGVTLQQWDLGGPSNSPAQQYNTIIGGSTELKPEESDTYTYGVVFTPDFAEGLSVSIDYYDIKVEDAIDTINQETTLVQCVEFNQFCDKVNRGVASSLWLGNASPTNGVDGLFENIGFFQVKGFDVEASYTFEIGSYGSVNVSNLLGYLESWEQEEYPGAGAQECQGKYGGACDVPLPELRNRFTTTWVSPWDFLINLTWRYASEVEQITASAVKIDIDEFNWFDLSGQWQASENLSIIGGVNNLTDKDPPITQNGVTQRNNGNTYPGAYDHLGQYWFLRANVQF